MPVPTQINHPGPPPRPALVAAMGATFVRKRRLYLIVPSGRNVFTLVNITDALYSLTGTLLDIQKYLDEHPEFQVPKSVQYVVEMYE